MIQSFASSSAQVWYNTDTTSNIDTLFIKPSSDALNAVLAAYQATTYDSNTGWNGSGVMGIDKSQGFLTYYYTTVASDDSEEVPSSLPMQSIPSYCQNPWDCFISTSWTSAEETICQERIHTWYTHRKQFEERWSKTDAVDTNTSSYHPEFFLGYCQGPGDYTAASSYNSTEVVFSWPECYAAPSKQCDNINFTLVDSLPEYSFWNSILEYGSFQNTDWTRVGFGGSNAKFTDFSRAILVDVSANHVSFQNTSFRDADVSGANFDHSNFKNADLTGATVTSETVFTSAVFGIHTIFMDGNIWTDTSFFDSADSFNGMRLNADDEVMNGFDFGEHFTHYVKSRFLRLEAHDASFHGCNLTDAYFWQIKASNADFSSAILSEVTFGYSTLEYSNFTSAVFDYTDLQHTNMQHCALEGADLSLAQIFDHTNLRNCSFSTSTTLWPAGFTPYCMRDTDGPELVEWPDCYLEENQQNCDNLNFTCVTESLWSTAFTNGSFVNTDWRNVGFGGSTLVSTNFNGANLLDASANHNNFRDATFVGANLSGAYFQYTDFRGTDFTNAIYSNDTDWKYAQFGITTRFPDGVLWVDTSFFDTSANGDFHGMRLNVDDENMTAFDFATKYSDYSFSSFNRLIAHDASFAGCDLSGASMWSLRAERANFTNADLTNTVMRASYYLQEAIFNGANFSGTELHHAGLQHCWLLGADLRNVQYDENTKFDGCRYDNTTLFPPDFDLTWLIDIHAPTSSPTFTPTLALLLSNTMQFEGYITECFSMGMNLASVVYYSNQMTFKNAFLESGGCCWPADAVVDDNGNLLEKAPAGYDDYWKAGRNLVYRVDGLYPGGTYVFHASGNGSVSFSFDAPYQTVSIPTPPEGIAMPITPSASGVQITIEETSATDPVRDIAFQLQEYDQEPEGASPFTPIFIETLRGMDVLRFMDMGRTNNNNIVHWADRTTKDTISQSRTIQRVIDIAQVRMPVSPPTSFIYFGLEFVTTEPHGLESGQTIKLEGLQGQVLVNQTDEGTTFVRDLSDVWYPKMVEVTSSTSFMMSIGNWWWDAENDELVEIMFNNATADRAILEIRAGVAYEYMIELSIETGADPWFCVPHLASDDYITQMATLIANELPSNHTVYVEYSNEVWNNIFTQEQYAQGMHRLLGLPSASQFFGQRSKQIFDIFSSVFASVGSSAPVLHKVLASQSVNTWISEQAILGAQGDFDSLAIAPYFSAHASDVYALSTDGQSVDGVTVTDVLELCVTDIYNGFADSVSAQYQLARQSGNKTLVAYEGGQHLGGQGPRPGGGRMEDDLEFQDLMIAANRDPRMHNLYQAYFKLWGEITEGTGTFAHFSFIGQPSKWGSWGVKESYYHNDTVEDSPKWMTVKGIADYCG